MNDVLSFDDFARYLQEELEVVDTLSAQTRFSEDLECDSIMVLEVVLIIEDTGVELSESMIEQMATVGDAYRVYLAAAQAA
jgi:acyl carrier protein